MEKLIELLNEREKELSPSVQVEWTEFSVGINKWYLISKECWFIKWLVDNNKINLGKAKGWEIMLSRTDEENIIWRLSISNSPIEDLISYLK